MQKASFRKAIIAAVAMLVIMPFMAITAPTCNPLSMSFIIALELVRTPEALDYILGPHTAECRLAIIPQLDHSTLIDTFFYIPAYTAFFVFVAHALGRQDRLIGRITMIIALACAVADVAENIAILKLGSPLTPPQDWVPVLIVATNATSGNRSGSPFIFKDADALTELSQVADFILTHNREIVLPQDDSVLRFSTFCAKQIILRRSRGLTGSVNANGLTSTTSVQLSFGASQKSTFTLLAADNLHTSQYLGDLEDWETQTYFKHTLQHLIKVFNVQPSSFLADAHEGYFSTQLAHEWAKATKSPLQKIQHHVAHFAAVLAEHQLTISPEPIAGIVWDGTGYGTDGHSWGGEFFLYFPNPSRPLGENIERIAHFEYFDSLAGDKMALEPRLSAFSLLFPEKEELLKNKFSGKESSFYAANLKVPLCRE